MLFTTPTQYIVLALALIGGWLLGLASHPGGRRWRERYATERDAHAATRRDAEARLAESNRVAGDAHGGTDDRLAGANARIAELERENSRLVAAAPAERQHYAVEMRGDTRVYTADGVRPVGVNSGGVRPVDMQPAGTKRGWFDWA